MIRVYSGVKKIRLSVLPVVQLAIRLTPAKLMNSELTQTDRRFNWFEPPEKIAVPESL
jgi:vacuolar-type H+-ATPase subunit D/Vma8